MFEQIKQYSYRNYLRVRGEYKMQHSAEQH